MNSKDLSTKLDHIHALIRRASRRDAEQPGKEELYRLLDDAETRLDEIRTRIAAGNSESQACKPCQAVPKVAPREAINTPATAIEATQESKTLPAGIFTITPSGEFQINAEAAGEWMKSQPGILRFYFLEMIEANAVVFDVAANSFRGRSVDPAPHKSHSFDGEVYDSLTCGFSVLATFGSVHGRFIRDAEATIERIEQAVGALQPSEDPLDERMNESVRRDAGAVVSKLREVVATAKGAPASINFEPR